DEYDVPVDSVSGAKFSDRFVSPLGNEPKVLGTAFSLEEEAVSGPIKGNSGVFVVQLQRKPLMPTATNIPAIRKNMSSTAKAEVNTRLIQAMKKEAEVEDYRSRFY
ncbi:MAG: hypothetical protein R3350_02310, partial [Saprospiraceae bacterium]|nr:hypothetical protein [Saprospiraceae bacterium]